MLFSLLPFAGPGAGFCGEVSRPPGARRRCRRAGISHWVGRLLLTSPNPFQLLFLALGHLSHVPCCHRLPLGDLVQDPGWHRPRCSAVRFWEQRDFGVVQSTQRAGSGPGWEFLGSGIYFFLIPWLGIKALHREGSFSWQEGSRPAPCSNAGRKLIIEVTLPKKNHIGLSCS